MHELFSEYLLNCHEKGGLSAQFEREIWENFFEKNPPQGGMARDGITRPVTRLLGIPISRGTYDLAQDDSVLLKKVYDG